MILKRKTYSTIKTDYSSLDPISAQYARERRKKVSGDIKKIDSRTSGLMNAAQNTLGSVPKSQIRKQKAAIKKAGNNEKLNRMLG